MTERTVPHVTARLMLMGMEPPTAYRHAVGLTQGVGDLPASMASGERGYFLRAQGRVEFEDRVEFYLKDVVGYFTTLRDRLLSSAARGHTTTKERERLIDWLDGAGRQRRITMRPMRQLFLAAQAARTAKAAL